MGSILVSGSFDDIRLRHVRFLEEAAKLGPVHAVVWSDEVVRLRSGESPKFTQEERIYFVQALRYVDRVSQVDGRIEADQLPILEAAGPQTWVVMEEDDSAERRAFCSAHNLGYEIVPEKELARIPGGKINPAGEASAQKKVIVTGCFDWLHSGHVRFFEETAELGDLYVVLGHDENVQLLKGEGHPMFPENERRYMVQAIRYVKQALVSSGHGWMDAEPEVTLLEPDIYAVNEDGDKPEKRAFCEEHGLEYVVLKRLPREGLPRRESTALRGF